MAEIGWGDEDGRLGGAAGATLLVAVAAGYWGMVWLASGLAPLAYVASHLRRTRRPVRTAEVG
jgi:hypothetical protein